MVVKSTVLSSIIEQDVVVFNNISDTMITFEGTITSQFFFFFTQIHFTGNLCIEIST